MKKFVFAHKFKAIGKMFSVFTIKEEEIDGNMVTIYEKFYDLNFDKDLPYRTQYRQQDFSGADRLYIENGKIRCLNFSDEPEQNEYLKEVNKLNWSYVVTSPVEYGGVKTNAFGISNGKVYYLFRDDWDEDWNFVEVIMTDSAIGIPGKAVKLHRIVEYDDGGAECFFIDENNNLWYLGNVNRNGGTDYCKADIEFEGFLNQRYWMSEFHTALAVSKNGSLYYIDAETSDGRSFIDCYLLQDGTNDKVINAYIVNEYETEGRYPYNYCYTFGFKESGLYYILPGGYTWKKIENCPDFIVTNFLGCTYLGVVEVEAEDENGEPTLSYIGSYDSQALFIDKSGKLYKAVVNYSINGSYVNVDNDNPIRFEQIGTDSDWNFVPSTINARGTYLAQKGGKIVKLNVSSDYNVTYTEYQQPDQTIGKLICVNQNMLIFKNGDFEYNITKL